MGTNPLIIVIGAYGSGKSEYCINLAKLYKDCGEYTKTPRLLRSHPSKRGELSVCLVDLDVVNPYFRSRYMKESFESEGIEVIAPEFAYGHADLPMISPRIRGAIQDTLKLVILDVGGDPAGCRALARFTEDIITRGYSLQLIINTRRPFMQTPEEIVCMKDALEQTSHLKVTELVCNTNLMQLTDLTLIKEGINIIKEVAQSQNLLFEKYLVLQNAPYVGTPFMASETQYPDEIDGIQKMNMTYYLRKPWEQLYQGNSFC